MRFSVYLFCDLAFCAALSSDRKLFAPNNYIRIVRFPSNACIRFVCFRSLLVAMPNCCKMSISIHRFFLSTRPHPFSAFLLINFPFYFSIIRCRLSTENLMDIFMATIAGCLLAMPAFRVLTACHRHPYHGLQFYVC